VSKNHFFAELLASPAQRKKFSWRAKISHLLKFHLLPFQTVIHRLDLFDKEIAKLGIARSSQRLLKTLNVQVQFINPPRLKRECGYIIFGNHPTYAEPFALFALLGSPQTKLISGDNVAKIGPFFSRYLFPVKNLQLRKGKPNSLFARLLFLLAKNQINFHQRQKAVAHNRKIVRQIPPFLRAKGKFIIFPAGQCTSPLQDRWKNGIGFILANTLKYQTCPPLQLLPFYVAVDHPRLFQLKLLYALPNKMKIIFGSPFGAYQFRHLPPKTIRQKLEEGYKNWLRQTILT